MPHMADLTKTCSKCGDNEVTGDGYPRWCANCKTLYRRENEAIKAGLKEKAGFKAGVDAMRASLAADFARAGSGVYYGSDVARLIMEVPGPKID